MWLLQPKHRLTLRSSLYVQPYDKMQIGKSLLTEAQVNSMDTRLLPGGGPAGVLMAP